MGIAVGGGVIDADYTGKVRVILRNHAKADCLYQAGDRIPELIVERIANAEDMKVDELGTTERGKTRFWASDLSLKRGITAKEEGLRICFLKAESNNKGFFSLKDIGYHPWLTLEKEMLSGAHLKAALTQSIKDAFVDKIKVAWKEHKRW